MSNRENDLPESGPPEATPPGATHLVITVHGIRTYGGWQEELAKLLKGAEPGVKVENYTYGYFSAFAFLVPPLRWLVARQFRKYLVHELERMPEGSRVDLVAHSFGTYLAAMAIPYIPEGRKVNTVIFAGSVLRPSFPWYKYQQQGRIGRVVNDCGWDDSVLVLCQATALSLGMAGRVGFHGMSGRQLVNRYYRFGHGGYFDSQNEFMREKWLPLLTQEDPIPSIDNRPRLTPIGGMKLFLMNNLHIIKVGAAFVVLLLLIFFPLDWLRKADYQKQIGRALQIARLLNAEKIPGRDPSHIRELIHLDANAQPYEKSVESIIKTVANAEGGDAVPVAEDFDPEPSGWWMFGFDTNQRRADRARTKHALANYQLAAGKQRPGASSWQDPQRGNSQNLAKAKELYEDALQAYASVDKADDPVHGSQALCLVDYGLLLDRMGLREEAIKQFETVRKDVFPQGTAVTASPRIPTSLVADSLCYEATVLKKLERWDLAQARLEQAVTAINALSEGPNSSEGRDGLLSFVYNELAWLKMERLDVAAAESYFIKAKDSCEDLAERGRFIFKIRQYHIKHGLAMALRLRGRTEESHVLYSKLVDDLTDLMSKDLDYYPKERRDLRARLLNSKERLADVWFFGRVSPASIDPKDEAGRKSYLAKLKSVQDEYNEAIGLVPFDEPAAKAKLYYKMFIARSLGEIARLRWNTAGNFGVRSEAGDSMKSGFTEAERTFESLTPELRKDLKIYKQIANCCDALRQRLESRDPLADPTAATAAGTLPAVGELRSVATDYAKRCTELSRDGVEMLFVALEVLLEPGVELDPRNRRSDATLLTSVVNATTQVAKHPELRNYVDRFTQIAAAESRRPTPGLAEKRSPVPAPAEAAPGSVLFYLRLAPGRALTVTDEAVKASPTPAPVAPEIATSPEPRPR